MTPTFKLLQIRKAALALRLVLLGLSDNPSANYQIDGDLTVNKTVNPFLGASQLRLQRNELVIAGQP